MVASKGTRMCLFINGASNFGESRMKKGSVNLHNQESFSFECYACDGVLHVMLSRKCPTKKDSMWSIEITLNV